MKGIHFIIININFGYLIQSVLEAELICMCLDLHFMNVRTRAMLMNIEREGPQSQRTKPSFPFVV